MNVHVINVTLWVVEFNRTFASLLLFFLLRINSTDITHCCLIMTVYVTQISGELARGLGTLSRILETYQREKS